MPNPFANNPMTNEQTFAAIWSAMAARASGNKNLFHGSKPAAVGEWFDWSDDIVESRIDAKDDDDGLDPNFCVDQAQEFVRRCPPLLTGWSHAGANATLVSSLVHDGVWSDIPALFWPLKELESLAQEMVDEDQEVQDIRAWQGLTWSTLTLDVERTKFWLSKLTSGYYVNSLLNNGAGIQEIAACYQKWAKPTYGNKRLTGHFVASLSRHALLPVYNDFYQKEWPNFMAEIGVQHWPLLWCNSGLFAQSAMSASLNIDWWRLTNLSSDGTERDKVVREVIKSMFVDNFDRLVHTSMPVSTIRPNQPNGAGGLLFKKDMYGLEQHEKLFNEKQLSGPISLMEPLLPGLAVVYRQVVAISAWGANNLAVNVRPAQVFLTGLGRAFMDVGLAGDLTSNRAMLDRGMLGLYDNSNWRQEIKAKMIYGTDGLSGVALSLASVLSTKQRVDLWQDMPAPEMLFYSVCQTAVKWVKHFDNAPLDVELSEIWKWVFTDFMTYLPEAVVKSAVLVKSDEIPPWQIMAQSKQLAQEGSEVVHKMLAMEQTATVIPKKKSGLRL